MSKIFLRDVGSHPERDLEVSLFPDGELQFEADNGKYVHINITRAGVKELLDFLLKEIRPTPLAPDGALCKCENIESAIIRLECKDCGLPLRPAGKA